MFASKEVGTRVLRSEEISTTTMILLVYVGLVAWVDVRNAPTVDELGHLASGIASWEIGTFDLYRVNPPLIRVAATWLVDLSRPSTDWSYYQREREDLGKRIEWTVGLDFLRRNIDRALLYIAIARWSCIPFGVMGAWFCRRWATELYGKRAGLMALILWCFSPNVITWSSTICPDAFATAFGVAAGYFFWRWLKVPGWPAATWAGTFLGLALLTKLTWVLLFGAWPFIWLFWICCRRSPQTKPSTWKQIAQFGWVALIGLFVLNIGYAFDGTCTKLGQFTFVSHTLAGNESITDGCHGGNRFAGSWLSNVPVPLPGDYVRGIDLQRVDFERRMTSYLFGHWKDCGWWYYYLACAALKVPIGTGLLVLLAVGMRFWRLSKILTRRSQTRAQEVQSRCLFCDELVILSPAIAVVMLVSCQTGFSRHFRYVLPASPFIFVWISGITPILQPLPSLIGIFTRVCLSWTIASSLWVYPHCMSYFNEAVGGPRNGHFYLLDSNIDWGQDTWYLKRWCKAHPEARPLRTLFCNPCSGDLLNSNNDASLEGKTATSGAGDIEPEKRKPLPGWYVLSIQRIHDPSNDYAYFLRFKPEAMAGYSFYIYHISSADVLTP